MSYSIKKINSYGTEVTMTNVPKLAAHSLVGLIALFTLAGSVGNIDEGERGVKTRFGEIKSTHEPGIYFKFPFVESMNKLEVRNRAVKYELEEPLFAASKDLQDVKVSVLVSYNVDEAAVEDVYRKYKTINNFETVEIRPAVRDLVKSQASLFTADELVTKRSEYNDAVMKALVGRLLPQGVLVANVNITNFEFSEQYGQSIEAKVTAEQSALKAENDLKRVQFEAQQRIEQAKAEAEAIRIQAEAITSQGGADYVKLKAIEKWNGSVPTHMIPNATVPFIELN